MRTIVCLVCVACFGCAHLGAQVDEKVCRVGKTVADVVNRLCDEEK